MSKRNAASVTDLDCTCGYLEESAADPNLPIRFDHDLNEYHIVYISPMGGRVASLIHHCPFCGGAAPQSRRGELFADVPEGEGERLRALTGDVDTVEDLIELLGPRES